MEQSSHCLCALTQIMKLFKSSCDQNKTSCIPMGIKNAQKIQGVPKKQSIENDLLLEFPCLALSWK